MWVLSAIMCPYKRKAGEDLTGRKGEVSGNSEAKIGIMGVQDKGWGPIASRMWKM